MIPYRYFDESFDTENCLNYILSIQCSLNGFSFLIYDPSSAGFIGYFEIDLNTATPFQLKTELEQLFKSKVELQKKYKRVNIIYQDSDVMLYPNSIIDESELLYIYRLMFEKKNGVIISHNEIQKGEPSILFSIPTVINDFFKDTFYTCENYAYGLPILIFGLKCTFFNPGLLINRNKNILQTAIIKDQKIKYLNHFFVKNDADCLYYTLYIAKQMELNKRTEVLLMGNFEAHSEYVFSLKNYFEKTHFARFNPFYSVSRTFAVKSDHYYLPLIELSLCGS